ncbi:protein ORF80 [Lake sturgeon herpesvirus]|nr:protein ORF80 [Lake sturgeon herpesvirus]
MADQRGDLGFLKLFFGVSNTAELGVCLPPVQTATKCTNSFRRISTISYKNTLNKDKKKKKEEEEETNGDPTPVKRPKQNSNRCGLCQSEGPLNHTLAKTRHLVCDHCVALPLTHWLTHSSPLKEKIEAVIKRCHVCYVIDEVAKFNVQTRTVCCSAFLCTVCAERWYKATVTHCDLCHVELKSRYVVNRLFSYACVFKSVDLEDSKDPRLNLTVFRHLNPKDLDDIVDVVTTVAQALPQELLFSDSQDVIDGDSLYTRYYDYQALQKALADPEVERCPNTTCVSLLIAGSDGRLKLPRLTASESQYSHCLLCVLYQQAACVSAMILDNTVYLDRPIKNHPFYFTTVFMADVDLTPVTLSDEFVVAFKGALGQYKPHVHYHWKELLDKLYWEGERLNTDMLLKQ